MLEITAPCAEPEAHWTLPEFLPDSALESTAQDDSWTRRLLPICISAGMHALALIPLLLLHTPPRPTETVVEPVFEIRLRRAPLAPAPPVPTPVEVTQDPVVPQAPSVTPARTEALPSIVEAVPVQPAPVSEPREAPAPSSLQIRQLVEQIRSEQGAASSMLICTPAQQRSPMFECPQDDIGFPEAGTPRAFSFEAPASPGNSLSLQRNRRLRASLAESGLSGQEIEDYLQAIDVNLQERATSGDARANQMRDQMFRNDSTYQQMQRALNPR